MKIALTAGKILCAILFVLYAFLLTMHLNEDFAFNLQNSLVSIDKKVENLANTVFSGRYNIVDAKGYRDSLFETYVRVLERKDNRNPARFIRYIYSWVNIDDRSQIAIIGDENIYGIQIIWLYHDEIEFRLFESFREDAQKICIGNLEILSLDLEDIDGDPFYLLKDEHMLLRLEHFDEENKRWKKLLASCPEGSIKPLD